MPIPNTVIHPVLIADLCPTQMTVGYREVENKRANWRKMTGDKASKYLTSHMIPILLGPRDKLYISDHHHLARALAEEGQKEIFVLPIADLSALQPDHFWTYLDNRGWLYLYDATGNRREHSDLPKSVMEMADDPYRSLAGELRRQGGFAKDLTPYSEFLWADALRRTVKQKTLDADFGKAMKEATQFAKSKAANFLPGWCAPD